jgi:hypothetical protein
LDPNPRRRCVSGSRVQAVVDALAGSGGRAGPLRGPCLLRKTRGAGRPADGGCRAQAGGRETNRVAPGWAFLAPVKCWRCLAGEPVRLEEAQESRRGRRPRNRASRTDPAHGPRRRGDPGERRTPLLEARMAALSRRGRYREPPESGASLGIDEAMPSEAGSGSPAKRLREPPARPRIRLPGHGCER